MYHWMWLCVNWRSCVSYLLVQFLVSLKCGISCQMVRTEGLEYYGENLGKETWLQKVVAKYYENKVRLLWNKPLLPFVTSILYHSWKSLCSRYIRIILIKGSNWSCIGCLWWLRRTLLLQGYSDLPSHCLVIHFLGVQTVSAICKEMQVLHVLLWFILGTLFISFMKFLKLMSIQNLSI